MAKKSRVPKPGAVVAVPRAKGGYYLLVHLVDNRFGDAFGILKGHVDKAEIPEGWKPKALGRHVYTGTHHIKKGLWSIVGHREELIGSFSKDPEIFHAKMFNPTDNEIGPYGCGETVSGVIRKLTRAEAKKLGLLDGTYQQVMMEEEVEEFLGDLLE